MFPYRQLRAPLAQAPGAEAGGFEKAYAEYGADVLVAQRVARYVWELGGLTPRCVRDGWRTIRAGLMDRGTSLKAFVNRYAPADLKAEALAALKVISDVADRLPGSPVSTRWVQDPNESWVNPERFGGEYIPSPPVGVLGFDWGAAGETWRESRWAAYIAAQAILTSTGVGTVGSVVLWGGVLVYEASTALAHYFKRERAELSDTEQADLERINASHVKWMQEELRGIWRQLHATHLIAKYATTDDDKWAALKATNTANEPAPPVVWDGTFPEDEESKPPSIWWVVAAMVGTAGVLWAVS